MIDLTYLSSLSESFVEYLNSLSIESCHVIGGNTMSNQSTMLTPSYVRSLFALFFNKVRVLYNISFNKDEKSCKLNDVKLYSEKLYASDSIGEYIKSEIDEAIYLFSLLMPGQIKTDNNYLAFLDSWISFSLRDLNTEISDLTIKLGSASQF